jgi:hypothetical protein
MQSAAFGFTKSGGLHDKHGIGFENVNRSLQCVYVDWVLLAFDRNRL